MALVDTMTAGSEADYQLGVEDFQSGRPLQPKQSIFYYRGYANASLLRGWREQEDTRSEG